MVWVSTEQLQSSRVPLPVEKSAELNSSSSSCSCFFSPSLPSHFFLQSSQPLANPASGESALRQRGVVGKEQQPGKELNHSPARASICTLLPSSFGWDPASTLYTPFTIMYGELIWVFAGWERANKTSTRQKRVLKDMSWNFLTMLADCICTIKNLTFHFEAGIKHIELHLFWQPHLVTIIQLLTCFSSTLVQWAHPFPSALDIST